MGTRLLDFRVGGFGHFGVDLAALDGVGGLVLRPPGAVEFVPQLQGTEGIAVMLSHVGGKLAVGQAGLRGFRETAAVEFVAHAAARGEHLDPGLFASGDPLTAFPRVVIAAFRLFDPAPTDVIAYLADADSGHQRNQVGAPTHGEVGANVEGRVAESLDVQRRDDGECQLLRPRGQFVIAALLEVRLDHRHAADDRGLARSDGLLPEVLDGIVHRVARGGALQEQRFGVQKDVAQHRLRRLRPGGGLPASPAPAGGANPAGTSARRMAMLPALSL